jgi:hypothetical protein
VASKERRLVVENDELVARQRRGVEQGTEGVDVRRRRQISQSALARGGK